MSIPQTADLKLKMKSNSAEDLTKLCEDYIKIMKTDNNKETLGKVEEDIIILCKKLNSEAISERNQHKAKLKYTQ